MPEKEKKKRDLPGDIENLKSRKELRKGSSGWAPRFWAWFIDAIIMAVVIEIVFPSSLTTLFNIDIYRAFVSFSILLVYWSISDSDGRQSIGKKVMGLRLADEQGNSPTISKAFVSSLGKSLLLPIDIIIGHLAKPGEKRRLFNIASDTVVVPVDTIETE